MAINGYYEFAYGIYAGIGGGLAFVETSVDSSVVAGGNKTQTSPLGAVMFGWSHKIQDRTYFDVRYRFSIFDAGSQTLIGNSGWVKMDSGIVKNNSLSVGIRYAF